MLPRTKRDLFSSRGVIHYRIVAYGVIFYEVYLEIDRAVSIAPQHPPPLSSPLSRCSLPAAPRILRRIRPKKEDGTRFPVSALQLLFGGVLIPSIFFAFSLFGCLFCENPILFAILVWDLWLQSTLRRVALAMPCHCQHHCGLCSGVGLNICWLSERFSDKRNIADRKKRNSSRCRDKRTASWPKQGCPPLCIPPLLHSESTRPAACTHRRPPVERTVADCRACIVYQSCVD